MFGTILVIPIGNTNRGEIMKILIIMSLFLSSLAFAGEAKTECPWMREMNKRNNPKANLVNENAKIKQDSKSSSSVRE
jgi:hypothetical protein